LSADGIPTHSASGSVGPLEAGGLFGEEEVEVGVGESGGFPEDVAIPERRSARAASSQPPSSVSRFEATR